MLNGPSFLRENKQEYAESSVPTFIKSNLDIGQKN